MTAVLAESGGLVLFRFERLPRDLSVHAISTRQGGVSETPYDTLNLSLSVSDVPERVAENRRRFCSALGFEPQQMIVSRQRHEDDVLCVDGAFVQARATADPPELPLADVQITNRAGWLLSLRFADCVPLILIDSRERAIGVVHAGWRGTLRGAARTAVRALEEHYAVAPSDLWVGIGPSIGPCCYEVGEEVAVQFGERPAGVVRNGHPRPHLDLWSLNRDWLIEAGVPAEQIELAELCTRCRLELYFSHRAQGFPAGRFSAAVGLR